MNILVCGGAGFIGSNFIHYYQKNNKHDKITCLDKLTYAGNLENLKELEENANFKFVKGDICDRELVFDLVKENDIIINFAAETHVDRSILDPSEFIKTNVIGTQILLDAIKKYDKRYHHVSTDEVFGSLKSDDPAFNEKTPYDPKSPYSASKAASDHLVRAYINTYNIKATISNCSNNYGPYMFPEKLFPLFISRLLEDKKVPVYGDGMQVRDWIFVDDHNKGVELIIKKGKIGETYCLGGNSEKTNLEVVKILLKLMDKDESYIEFVKDRPGHDRRYAIDFSKAKKELGFEPEISFEEGLKKTVEWYKNNQDWLKNCIDGSYQEYYNKNYNN